jgi:hypothetical protein
MLEIQVMAWDRHKNVAGLNQLMGFQPSQAPFLITIFQFHVSIKHTCEPSGGSIFHPILRVPPVHFQNLPPVKKIKYNKILAYILQSIFLEIPHLELPH